MTSILIKKFIRNYNDTDNTDVRSAYGTFSSMIGIICNVFLFIGKILVGAVSGSVSITADAVNNLSDASSSVISFVGFKLANRPPDTEHPYGHGRYEYLSAFIVALLIMIIGVELFKSGIEKILHPTATVFSPVSMAVLVFMITVKLWMAIFNTKIGKKIKSKAILATAADSRNDVITSAAVVAAAIISHLTNIELDGYMGAAVAVFILYSGFGLVTDTLNPLLGRAPDNDLVMKIRNKILSYPGVTGTHDLMIHDYGPGRQFASVHVEMPAEIDPLESHDVIDNIERDFLENDSLHMIIHYDPIATTDSEAGMLREWIDTEIKTLDERLSIHDLRITRGTTHTNVIFDCVVPNDMEIGTKEIRQFLNNIVHLKYPNYYCIVTIDRSYAALPH